MNIKAFHYLVLAILLSIVYSCKNIYLHPLNKEKVSKCKKCKDFLKKYSTITAPYQEYDKIYPPPDEILIHPDSLKRKPKANIMKAAVFSEIKEHLFCFIGMTKYEIESRFDSTITNIYEDSFELNKTQKYESPSSVKPDEEIRTVVDLSLGHYKDIQGAEYPILVKTERWHALSFNYDIIKGDTIYPGVVGDDILLKECFEAEGLKYKDN